MNDTMNQREKILGFLYVSIIFVVLTVTCCLLLFYYNSNYRSYSQKEYVIAKMNRIREYQSDQNRYETIVDSLHQKITKFDPGINAVYEEEEIKYMLNELKSVYEKRSWDSRYKIFMQISFFYNMWYVDKRTLWSKQSNITKFRKNLEECEIGLEKKQNNLKLGI